MTESAAVDSNAFAAVVIVNFGSSTLLEVNAVRLPVSDERLIVVVDCFSTTRERSLAAALCATHGWDFVPLEHNAGFGGGMNAGAAHALGAGADVIVALNPDATIDEGSLTRLVDAARSDPSSLVSPWILTGDGSVWFAGSDLYLDDGTSASWRRRPLLVGRPRREWATGACFAISAGLWQHVGGFDEDYFLYWEDVDLSHRLLDAGGRLVLLDDATAVHDEGQTQGRRAADRAKSETYYYYNIRNRLLYAAKRLDDHELQAWLRCARRVSFRILLQGGRRQLIRTPAPWRAYLRGLRDGRAEVAARRG